MRTNISYLALAASLAFASVVPSLAADSAPSVDSILAKHVEAMGGKAALEKITSRVIKVKLESATFGGGEGEITAKAPNKQHSQIDITGVGPITEGFDGKVAWAKSSFDGLREKSGEELAKTKRDADFYKEVDLKKTYPDLTYKGTEKVEGAEALVLESKPGGSGKERLFFDPKTYLMVRQESTLEGPQGSVTIMLSPGDYKAVDGVKVPQTLKYQFGQGGNTIEFTIKIVDVKHNVEVPDSKFAKPSA